jgi:hypothetical protein
VVATTSKQDLQRWRENRQEEIDSASQYHAMVEAEPRKEVIAGSRRSKKSTSRFGKSVCTTPESTPGGERRAFVHGRSDGSRAASERT